MTGYIKNDDQAEWLVVEDDYMFWTPDKDEATEVTLAQFEHFEERHGGDIPLHFDIIY